MSVTAAKGFKAVGIAAGLKSTGHKDVALVVNRGPLDVAAAVVTSNRVFAAPVRWIKEVIPAGKARAVVINSGGANACTGEPGYQDTVATATYTADLLSLTPPEILVCSTGLIGVRLDMPKLLSAVDHGAGNLATDNNLAADGGYDAAVAIMTTDTVPKMAAVTADGWTVGGMAKGAGMLAPGLATMLSVITTDAVVTTEIADRALRAATGLTFDRVDSDGCMSTNDTVILLVSGSSGVEVGEEEFTTRLTQISANLSRQLVADAEGASHDIAVRVYGATTEQAAVAVARAVTRSNLFKAAVFGNDPNWGRVLSAVGTVPPEVAPYNADKLDVSINGVQVCIAGGVGEDRNLVDLAAHREVTVDINLYAGAAEATVWTNDLTHDYVHENSAYSS